MSCSGKSDDFSSEARAVPLTEVVGELCPELTAACGRSSDDELELLLSELTLLAGGLSALEGEFWSLLGADFGTEGLAVGWKNFVIAPNVFARLF